MSDADSNAADVTHVGVAHDPDDVVRRVTRIWSALLETDDIATDANFFDVGGTSVLLVKMRDAMSAELGCTLRLVEMFSTPTIDALAARVVADRA